jgi:hypothetical protein
MDEQSESTGSPLTADTQEYRYRTISILNSLLPALYPFSDNYDTSGVGRPVCPPLVATDYRNPDFTQAIPVDDTLARAVLPFGLAAYLLAPENESLSIVFKNQYQQTFADLRNRIPGAFEPISTPYGLF